MIPKIIHYCWFGENPLPPLALECIASWRKFLPEYEIWMWCEQNSQVNGYGLTVNGASIADRVMSFDVNYISYTAEAYKQQKYAFVSDYCRFWVLHEYGGVYFDTDVEVIRPMDDILAHGAFMGIELDTRKGQNPLVNPGLGLACEKDDSLIEELVNYYETLRFDLTGGSPITIVGHTTDVLKKHGLQPIAGIQQIENFTIYPSEYFCPIHNITKRLHITNNTRSIHRYMDSWNDRKVKSWKDVIRRYIPESILLWLNYLKH